MLQLPMPPLEIRKLVGETNERAYDNPSGQPVFPYIRPEQYATVFDWGCGCGRIARQLIQQDRRPARYVGVDLNPVVVNWCRDNLAPHAPSFRFEHLDVANRQFNPGGAARFVPFPVENRFASLLVAWSVFTHVIEPDAQGWLDEVARVLQPEGVAVTTWLLFDKTDFPMMQEFQNALYINPDDPTNAVIYDRAWLREAAHRSGLVLWKVFQPAWHGGPRRVLLKQRSSGADETEFAPPSEVRVQWLSADVPRELRAGTSISVSVTFANSGSFVWTNDETFGVKLTYSWSGGVASERVLLPRSVAPGESVTVQIDVRAPESPGDSRLTFDLLQDWVYWFSKCGADVLTIPVKVL